MRVRAKFIAGVQPEKARVVGYYDERRIREGEEFEIPDEPLVEKKFKNNEGKEVKEKVPQAFSPLWMERCDAQPARLRQKKLVNEVEMSNPNAGVI